MTSPRRLALFDLDGTITRHDTYVPFVIGLLLRHPSRWLRALRLIAPVWGYAHGRVDRGALKGDILHQLFGGLPRTLLGPYAERYAGRVVPRRLLGEALRTFQAHLQAGDHVVVLSASPDLFVPAIAHRLGAHEVHCTAVRWDGDRLDGRLAGPNRRDHEKARVLEQLRAAHPGLPVIAYGNSGADLIHMERCEEAVFVNAGPRQAAELTARGIRCVQWR